VDNSLSESLFTFNSQSGTMANLPRFTFPLLQPENSQVLSASDPPTSAKEGVQVSLPIHAREGKGYTLSVPDLEVQIPGSSKVISTPPESPARQRVYTMGTEGPPPGLQGSETATPPPTPTKATRGSISSLGDFSESLRRGHSISYERKNSVLVEKEKPGSTEPRVFPYWETDYDVAVHLKGRKKPLGSGAWSKVYRASSTLPKLDGPTPLSSNLGADMTPPLTPVHSRNTSLSKSPNSNTPSAYAIKEPSGRTAKRVLADECLVLSYLSRFGDAEKYIVPFYGQDMRTEALVLGLMDGTLEDWIAKELNDLPEEDRAAQLAKVFPALASQLVSGFTWMTSKHCTHGDLKPANILVSSLTPDESPHAVFTDFSSSVLSTDMDKIPIGGATYDYLDPTLMTKASANALPTPTTDLWALAITLLFVVIGTSPYNRVAPNEIMKRELSKQGDPLKWLAQGENGTMNRKRLEALGKRLGWDVAAWFGLVLKKDLSERVGVEEWKAALEQGVGLEGSKL
jgi:hypothetical protein